MFIGNNAIAYSISGKIVLNKTLNDYDTDSGIVEFREMIKQQAKERLEKEQEKLEYQKAQEEAKRLGRKLEMVYDPKIKKMKAAIVEKNNA